MTDWLIVINNVVINQWKRQVGWSNDSQIVQLIIIHIG